MRFATDENFDGRILSGLQARLPDLDILRVQDSPMYQAPDPELLAWAAVENRVLLTHDVQTLPGFAHVRVHAALTLTGVIVVKRVVPLGAIIDELEVMLGAGEPEDFLNQVRYIPMR